MTKKLSVIGNSLGLILDKPILELLKLDRDTELELTTDGERLVITPVRSGHRSRVRAAAGRAIKRHRETLRKLAQ
jgi:antitoxin MazE